MPPLYVIQSETGLFVSAPGSDKSYTSDLTQARTFSSVAAAVPHRCKNERIIRVDTLLNPPDDSLR